MMRWSAFARLGSPKNPALGAYRFCSAATQNPNNFNSIPLLLLINEILINVAEQTCASVLQFYLFSFGLRHRNKRRRFYLNTAPQRRN